MLDMKDDLQNLSTKVHDIEKASNSKHGAQDQTVNAKIHELAEELDSVKKSSITKDLSSAINELLELDDEAFAKLSRQSSRQTKRDVASNRSLGVKQQVETQSEKDLFKSIY